MRKELFTVVFFEPINMNSVLSGLSFNLFVNMKFWMLLGNFLVFVQSKKNLLETVKCIAECHFCRNGN